METLLQSDIFFFIYTIESLLLTVFIATLFYYLIRAGKNLYKISEALSERFEDSEEFVTELKQRLEDNLVFQFFFPPSRKRVHRKEK